MEREEDDSAKLELRAPLCEEFRVTFVVVHMIQVQESGAPGRGREHGSRSIAPKESTRPFPEVRSAHHQTHHGASGGRTFVRRRASGRKPVHRDRRRS